MFAFLHKIRTEWTQVLWNNNKGERLGRSYYIIPVNHRYNYNVSKYVLSQL